jgi:hypothetical protein
MPYWEYLERENRAGATATYGPRECDRLRPAEDSPRSGMNAPRLGDVSPVRGAPAAIVREAYQVSRVLGSGRVIDVTA